MWPLTTLRRLTLNGVVSHVKKLMSCEYRYCGCLKKGPKTRKLLFTAGWRAVRSQPLYVPKAHAGGNQLEYGTDIKSAGGPGEAGFMIDDRY